MKIRDMLSGGTSGTFLKPADIGDIDDQAVVTIRELDYSESVRDGETRCSYFLMFDEYPGKKWDANVTNRRTIHKVLGGEDTDEWIGRKIILKVQEVQNPQGETVPGIRVSLKLPPGENGAAKPAAGPRPLGEAAEAKLLGELPDKKDLDNLRKHLTTAHPDMAPILAGQPRGWPFALGVEIKKWLDDGHATPF